MSLTLSLPGRGSRTYDRPVIMGILNVTPDSFSDGGLWGDVDGAVGGAKQMLAAGADIIDVGGESTRPGSKRVDADEQIRRVVPVIQALSQEVEDVVISVDTTLSAVAQAAVGAGAVILNDVSAGRDDPAVFTLAAQRGLPLVLMHMLGNPQTMQQHAAYADVVSQVEGFLLKRAQAALAAGVRREQILIDPGIGFGKTTQHNLTLLAHLHRLVSTGFPVLLGASRKRFLRQMCHGSNEGVPPSSELVSATCATTVWGVSQGVAVFRVHDVLENRRAADTAWAIAQARPPTRH